MILLTVEISKSTVVCVYELSWVKHGRPKAVTCLFYRSLENPKETGDNLIRVKDRVLTISGGNAKGKLLGGNLTVLTTMIESDYLPDFEGNILFLEEVGEDV
jgi:muramoyltetrapeptide carboxypeptidase LdcA involved in peptidoglycan recycling